MQVGFTRQDKTRHDKTNLNFTATPREFRRFLRSKKAKKNGLSLRRIGSSLLGDGIVHSRILALQDQSGNVVRNGKDQLNGRAIAGEGVKSSAKQAFKEAFAIMARLYDVKCGLYRLDGTPIVEARRRGLRKNS